jgi:hypothetical protein
MYYAKFLVSKYICKTTNTFHTAFTVVLATGPVLDPAGFIGPRSDGLTPSKIDDFLSELSLSGHKY